MRVAVIGLGSMGRRRIRLIQKYNDSIKIFGVDNNDSRRKDCYNEFYIKTYNNLDDVIKDEDINCAFICTSPLTHNSIISQCLKYNLHVFSELNLVKDGYDDNQMLSRKKNLKLFLSSTFLYREEINKINSIINGTEERLNYIYHVGQYLPDWHPWENYKDYFVANKRTNACREILAIELPWIVNTFGDISNIHVIKDKMSNLQIDYVDNYIITIQHKNGYRGSLSVDIVSRKAVRNLEVYGEKLYLRWDGTPNGLFQYDSENRKEVNVKVYDQIDQLSNYSNNIVENAYYKEIVAFFEQVETGKQPVYNFEKDAKILDLIDKIEA